jgi:hypothetical protein
LGINPNNSNSDVITGTANHLIAILKGLRGKVGITYREGPILSISLEGNKIFLDISDASVFGMSDNNNSLGFFDSLKATKTLAEILDAEGLTLSILRKGKEALTIGRPATPKVSTILTRSDDIQVDSVREVAKLSRDLKKQKNKA